MKTQPKSIRDQVIVITGASNGIGLATAKEAAKRGAKVVLCSRNVDELTKTVEEIERMDGDAAFLAADVADAEAMLYLADFAIQRFGKIDTWINNAGVAIYGQLTKTPLQEKRRLFDVNFWGMVHGCRAAIPHLRKTGGALINVGSIASEMAVPLQGIYSASKHAVKAYTETLRMELEHENIPVSVTLVQPGSNPSRAILSAAERPLRNFTVGGMDKLQTAVIGIALAALGGLGAILATALRSQRSNPSRTGRRTGGRTVPDQRHERAA